MSDEDGLIPAAPGRLAGRLGARRTAWRGRGAAARGLDPAEPDLPAEASPEPSPPDIIVPRRAAADRAAVRGLAVVRGRAVERRAGAAATGFTDCMDLAAVISALAAEVIALVAVFIDCIADDIVFADAVAFVAAAVILVAAEFTLVAADDTPLAAVAGVAPPRPDVPRRVVLVRVVVLRVAPGRLAVPRLPAAVLRVPGALPRRAAAEREAVEREAVDRDAVVRVDRDAVLRDVPLAAVPRADPAALLRLAGDIAADVPEPDMDFDRLAVPCDALRFTGLLRAELAELRRVAARVVD